MEPEVSLMCSQDPATGPCPEPFEFSPHAHTIFILFPFYYFVIYAQVS
jgi:hypothetical protein